MTHTPGPWSPRYAHNGNSCIYSEQNRFIAQVADEIDGPVIAAAPELLDQLKFVLDWIEGQQSIGEIHKGLDFPAARAAIAKAEGTEK